LEKAIYLATHGRPGPVWLDIPLDVQGTMIDEDELPGYDHSEDIVTFDQDNLHSKVAQAIELLKSAERPVFLAGHGIRIANAQQLFLDVVEKMRVPVVTSMNGFDLIPSDNPFFIGRIGTVANRAGNFALQNSDLLLSVGSRNNIRQISYNWDAYARAAKKIIVDIDDAELKKSTIKPDLAIHADAKAFLEEFLSQITSKILPSWDSWREWCTERKMCYQAVLAEDREARNLVNPYYFMEVLSGCLQENELVVAGNGTAFLVMFQAGKVKKGQRFIWNSGCASMGYDLPAAIGACFANEKRQVVCIAGDGSLQMNIQELQTIVHHNLPIKLFVLNNNGYISIKQTQDNFFSGHRVACDKTCGVSFPDLGKIAAAYGLPFELIENQLGIEDRVNKILNINGPLMCEVRLITDYKFSPKLSSETKSDGQIISKPLEDLYPFLDREEFRNNLLIPEWKP
jgi:acetolactate synthase-1/2/3 large subunit